MAACKRNARADAAKGDAEAGSLRTLLRTRSESLASDQVVSGA